MTTIQFGKKYSYEGKIVTVASMAKKNPWMPGTVKIRVYSSVEGEEEVITVFAKNFRRNAVKL